MNIYEISKKSGVSTATVSRCINNSGYVSQKTRERIERVIEENGYSPNPFARSIAGSSVKTIGILCTDLRDLFQTSCIYHLEKNLRKEGYHSMLVCTGSELEARKKGTIHLYAQNPDALIFVGSQFVETEEDNNRYIKDVSAQIPVMLLNDYLEADNIYCIEHDDFKAASLLCSRMLEAGCRHPVFLGRRMNHSTKEKMEGFLKACKSFEDVSPKVYFVKDDLDEIFNCIEDLHLAGKETDGYLCADDEIAIAAIKYIAGHEQQIPLQVQVCSFNNSILSMACSPQLTTYDLQIPYLCQSAVLMLTGVLRGENFPNLMRYEGREILRQSTKEI